MTHQLLYVQNAHVRTIIWMYFGSELLNTLVCDELTIFKTLPVDFFPFDCWLFPVVLQITIFMHNLHGWPCMISLFFQQLPVFSYFNESERDINPIMIGKESLLTAAVPLDWLLMTCSQWGQIFKDPILAQGFPWNPIYWFIKNPFVKPLPTYSLFLTQILLFTSNSNWPTCYVCLGEGSSFMSGLHCIILGVYLGLHVWQRAATRGLRPILRQG